MSAGNDSRARRIASRVASAARRTRAQATGADPAAAEPSPGKARRKRRRKAAAQALAHEQVLLHELQKASGLTGAVLRQARALLDADDAEGAAVLGEALRLDPATAVAGDLVTGIVAFQRGFTELAWARLGALPRDAWVEHAPAEYVRAGLTVEPQRTLATLAELADERPTPLSPQSAIALVGPVFAVGEQDLARRLQSTLGAAIRDASSVPDHVLRRRDWIAPWVGAEPGETEPRRDRPVFAVMDYGHPGIERGSANLGDHVQSIASLGHLVRHRSVRLHGAEDVVGLLEQLGDRTRPELALTDVTADLDVMTIHRDASMYQAVPEGTWTLCFGWFMHQLFRMRYGFPLHDALRPIFVSFHCNKRELLTDDAIAYLRRYGPVGCRDWTTVYLLLSVGVPAFFSGCMTTTLSTVFPDLVKQPSADAPVAYVDVEPSAVPKGAPTYHHSNREVRRRSFIANTYDALELLETYRRKHSAVVTSRLHCYLPMRSLGVPVEFVPGNNSDIRFDGLAGIDDAAFEAIRTGILAKLEKVFAAILSGTDETDVYALWADLTRDEVAAAEAKLAAAPHGTITRGLLATEVAAAVEGTVTLPDGSPHGLDEEVHCTVLAGSAAQRVPILVRSLVRQASRPLHVWVLGGPDARQVVADLSREHPAARFSWVPTDGLDRDVRTPSGDPVAGLARLLLPELLPGVQRVVVLPVDAVVDDDVAELASLDLGGHALAVPLARRAGASGFGVLHNAAGRLGDRTRLAAELRRTAHARHAFDFDAFSHELMVVDLAAAADQLDRDTALSLVSDFGLRPREVLHYLVGPDHAAVPDEWYHVPGRDPHEHAHLWHWEGATKPWSERFVPGRDRWQEHETSGV